MEVIAELFTWGMRIFAGCMLLIVLILGSGYMAMWLIKGIDGLAHILNKIASTLSPKCRESYRKELLEKLQKYEEFEETAEGKVSLNNLISTYEDKGEGSKEVRNAIDNNNLVQSTVDTLQEGMDSSDKVDKK